MLYSLASKLTIILYSVYFCSERLYFFLSQVKYRIQIAVEMKKLYSVVALLFFIESVVTQAPGDGSEICLPGGDLAFLRFPIPENMKVLMESRDYETLLGNQGEPDTWQQVDVNGLEGAGTIVSKIK